MFGAHDKEKVRRIVIIQLEDRGNLSSSTIIYLSVNVSIDLLASYSRPGMIFNQGNSLTEAYIKGKALHFLLFFVWKNSLEIYYGLPLYTSKK